MKITQYYCIFEIHFRNIKLCSDNCPFFDKDWLDDCQKSYPSSDTWNEYEID